MALGPGVGFVSGLSSWAEGEDGAHLDGGFALGPVRSRIAESIRALHSEFRGPDSSFLFYQFSLIPELTFSIRSLNFFLYISEEKAYLSR